MIVVLNTLMFPILIKHYFFQLYIPIKTIYITQSFFFEEYHSKLLLSTLYLQLQQ